MITALKPRPVPIPEPVLIDRSNRIRTVACLIVLYIFLLIFEGALRKWVMPKYSDPLLVIRDPVLILIYVAALWARVFPRNGWLTSLVIIGLLSAVVSVFIFLPFLATLWKQIGIIVAYGFRSNFLHLPLIFIMAAVFDENDIKRIGWWVLLGMNSLSFLIVAQFQ